MLKTIHCTVEENYSQTPLKVVATIVQGYLHPAPIGRSAHTGSHAQTGRVSDGGGIRTLNVRCVDRNLCARSGQKSILCHLCMDRGNVGEKQRAFGTETRTVRVSVPRRRGPAGSRCPLLHPAPHRPSLRFVTLAPRRRERITACVIHRTVPPALPAPCFAQRIRLTRRAAAHRIAP